jgi:hypothetical protein
VLLSGLRHSTAVQEAGEFFLWTVSGGVFQPASIQNMTNLITDPTGVQWLATSDMGFYWAGFGIGCLFFGFGMILRMARRVTGTTSDF